MGVEPPVDAPRAEPPADVRGEQAGSVKVEAGVLSSGGWSREGVEVPLERPLTLTLNGEEILTLLASPGDAAALAVGFLYDEGIIDSLSQLEGIDADDDGVELVATGVELSMRLFERRVLSSGCGKAFAFGSALDAFGAARRSLPAEIPWVSASAITRAAETAYSRGGLYKRTRGVHGAGLFERSGDLVTMAEDIGRHNAVDKAVGRLLLAGRPLDDLFMVVTGRISSEMVGKIAKTPVPLIASKSVPTGLALDYARRLSLCVVGRAVGSRLTVYTFPELIESHG
jgi:FdhD protein